MKRWESAVYWTLLSVALAVFAGAVWLAFHTEGLLTELP